MRSSSSLRSNQQLLDYKPLMSWMDFNKALSLLDSKRKGDAFELLCKYYFILHPKNEHINREKVWLLSEVPMAVKKELSIGEDTGFDLLLQDKQGNYIPVQCKYHSDPKKNLTWEEASTFFGKYYSNNKYQQAYLCTSAYGVSRHYEDAKTKPVIRVMGSDFQSLDKDFFEAVRCELEGKKHSYEPYKPRAHQEKAIKDAKKHFLKDGNSRGKLIFPCGSGKSLTGFWLAQELKAESVVVAVPSLSLVKQTLDVYLREIVANKKSVEWLCICSEADIGASAEVKFELAEVGVPCTTDEEAIKSWLERTKGSKRIIFTTYQSGRLIGQISKALGQSFDLGIFDEAHKTVGSTSKLFSFLLFEENINIHKRVFMTATERFYSGSKDDIVSMDDADIYGEVFTHMSFKDAIEQNLLTDYKVITIDVSKAEIATFIRDNKLVELSKEYGKEAEARSLASMLALRKAMKSFGIKNAVSFHSSIRKAQNASQVQDYISKHYDFKPIDSFTVDGKMATGKREVIINEFADSPKALITNARCLTEGVDVPNIDCIVFADPRRSKIDIVQALGRALRKKEGKEWGYVILPVVYDEDTHEIDNDNFKEIINIIRGLAANDERIIDHFKDKNSLEKSGGGQLTEEQFMFLTETLDESEFKGQLSIKLWEGLSRFNWLPFEIARQYARSLELNGQKEWVDYCKSSHRNKEIPQDPRAVYKLQWKGYGDWLGTGRIANGQKEFPPYEELKSLVNKLGIESGREYRQARARNAQWPINPEKIYEKTGWVSWFEFLNKVNIEFIPYEETKALVSKVSLKSHADYHRWAKKFHKELRIPIKPNTAYREDWRGWPDFLGTKNYRKINYWPFEKARAFVRKLKFNSGAEWRLYRSGPDRPLQIPSNPNRIYADKGWISMSDWIGKSVVPEIASFKDARIFARNLQLKSWKDWREYVKNNGLPSGIPVNPDQVYKLKGWVHIGDWLGNDDYRPRVVNPMDFKKARELIRSMEFKSVKEWNQYRKSKNRHPEIPKSPETVYQGQGFTDLYDWIGLEKHKWREFKAARAYVHTLKLKSLTEWRTFCQSGERPDDIPSNPNSVYSEYTSAGDWLGNGNIRTADKIFLSFKEARNIVHKLSLKNQKDWQQWAKSKRPSNIPYSPQLTYKNNGWVSFSDWLGTETFDKRQGDFYDFQKARNFIRGKGIKSFEEWLRWYKNHKPEKIPSNPDKTYKDSGWKGWKDFLGTDKGE